MLAGDLYPESPFQQLTGRRTGRKNRKGILEVLVHGDSSIGSDKPEGRAG